MSAASPYFQTLRKKEPKNKNFHRLERKLKKEPEHIRQDILQDKNWCNSNLLSEAIINNAPESTIIDLIKRYPESCNSKDIHGNIPIFLLMSSKTCMAMNSHDDHPHVLREMMKHLPKKFFKSNDFLGKILVLGIKNKYCSKDVIKYWINQYPSSSRFLTERYKKTVLQIALEEKRCITCIQCLLDAFPEAIKIPNVSCMLPLHFAVFVQSKLDIIQLLYETFPEAIQLPVKINKRKFNMGDDDDDDEEDGDGVIDKDEKDDKVEETLNEKTVERLTPRGNEENDNKEDKDVNNDDNDDDENKDDDYDKDDKTIASIMSLDSLTSSLSLGNNKNNNKDNEDNIIHLALQRKCDYHIINYLLTCLLTSSSSSQASSLRVKDKHGIYPLHLAILNNRGWEKRKYYNNNNNNDDVNNKYSINYQKINKSNNNNSSSHVISHQNENNLSITDDTGLSDMLCKICNESINKKKNTHALSPVLLKHVSGKTTFQLAIENASPEDFLLHMLAMEPSAATISIDNGELPLFLAFKYVPIYYRFFHKMLSSDISVATTMLKKNVMLLNGGGHDKKTLISKHENYGVEIDNGNHQLLPKIRRTKSIAISSSSPSSASSSSSSSNRRLSRTLSSPKIENNSFENDEIDDDLESIGSQDSYSRSSRGGKSRRGRNSVSSSRSNLNKNGAVVGGNSRSNSRNSVGSRSVTSKSNHRSIIRRRSSSHSTSIELKEKDIDNRDDENDDDEDEDEEEDEEEEVEEDVLFVTSALHEALRYGQSLEACEFILLLLSKTCHSFLLKRDYEKNLPLHLALNNSKLNYPISSSSSSKKINITEKSNNINLNSTNHDGKNLYEKLLYELIMTCPSSALQLDAGGKAPYHIALLKRAPPDIIQLLASKAPQFVVRTTNQSCLPGMSAHTSMLASFSKGLDRKSHDLTLFARNLPSESSWTNRYEKKSNNKNKKKV